MDSRHSWLNAGLAFAAMFVSVGTGFSYGALVLPATRDLDIAQGTTAGVFAVTVMMLFLGGAPAGILSDRWGPRIVLLLGAGCLGAGLVVTATAESAVMLYIGHGVLVGLGMAAAFIPMTAVVSASFLRHRSLALGIAVSGIGVGTLVMAPVIASLIDALGWRDAYQTLAVACGGTMLACALLVGRPPISEQEGARPGRVMRSRDYRILYLGQMLVSVAIFIPFAHLPAYAQESGSGTVAAAGLVGVIGATSVVGRLALGPIADRLGVLQVYRGCFIAIGASFVFWLWPGDRSLPLLVHAVMFGLGYGGFIALVPVVVSKRFGTERMGGLLGILYTSHAIGSVIGPLGTGLLIQRYGYWPAASTALVTAAIAVVLLRAFRFRPAEELPQHDSRVVHSP